MVRVFPETKQLVLPYRADVENILTPTVAQRFEANNAWWLAVEHSVQAVRLLRNLGLNAPSPILTQYNWGGGVPFASQMTTADMCTIHRRAYVLSEMGVGKTRAVLWAYDYLRRMGLVGSLLVVAPLSTLTTVWETEIFENLPHLSRIVLYGDKKRRQRLLNQPADVYIINNDGVGVIHKELYGRHDIDIVIIDELAMYRNSRNERWKVLEPIVKRSKYAWGLTGTPTINAPTDAFGQSRLLTPEHVGFSFKHFKNQTMQQVGTFKWIERAEAKSIVHGVLQPAVRFTRDECFDLPPTTYSARSVQLDPPAQRAYNEMHKELATQVRSHEITAANAGVKLSKLLQISAGFAYDADGLGRYIGGTDRFRQVFEIIEQTEHKVIVFASFRYMVEMLAGVLGKRYRVGMIHGDVTKSERDQIFSNFQKATSPHVIVADPRAMAHGLTLTQAATIIWSTPTTSLETYLQANARIVRPGQTNSTCIINLVATKAEAAVYSRLRKKESFQTALLEMFEDS